MLGVTSVLSWSRGPAVALAFVAFAAHAETTVWLVRPLYPGQEALVEKTERGLDRLLTGDARKDSLIGARELAGALKGKTGEEVPCLSGDARCADPTDAYVASLGFGRVMMIMGGQDEVGFKFKVASYDPRTGKSALATATNPVLEKALLGAVVKVFPASATLDVKSTPSGATVYVDDQKMGTTPLSTQVLPGEHVVRLDLKLHQGVEENLFIPIRGAATLDKLLEKVTARVIVTASPAGTSIAIDGQVLGKDRVDRGITPGDHTLRLTADGYKAYEQTVTVKAEEQLVLDKMLEKIAAPEPAVKTVVIHEPAKTDVPVVRPQGGRVGPTPGPPIIAARTDTPVPPAVVLPPLPKGPTESEITGEQRSYFQFGFQYARFMGNSLVGRRWGTAGTGRTETFLTPSRYLVGGEAEYGATGQNFGLSVIGLTYLTNVEHAGMSVGFAKGTAQEVIDGVTGPDVIDPVKIHLLQLRALQPLLRVCFWKVTLWVQGGFELRTGQIVETTNPFYKDGFMPLDVLFSARGGFKLRLIEGFYLYGAGNYAVYLTGETTDSGVRSGNTWGFNSGFGYGF